MKAPLQSAAFDESLLRDTPVSGQRHDRLKLTAQLGFIVAALRGNLPGYSSGERPRTLAIFGPWGSGKSSLLNMTREELAAEASWVDFDAWRYSGSAHGNLVVHLLHAMKDVVVKQKPAFAEQAKAVTKGTILAALQAVLNWSKADLNVKDIAEIMETLERLELPPSPASAVQRVFQALVSALSRRADDSAAHVVIAIDNLDRCSPESAISSLELLYLIMESTPGCTVVVAVDQGVLIDFISHKYSGSALSGAKYLEKIFPDYVRVPDPWVWHAEAEGVIKDLGRDDPDDDIIRLLGFFWKDWPLLKGLAEADDVRMFLWEAFSQSVALRNPRRIKRIMRRMWRLERADCQDDGDWSQESFESVFVMVVLSDLWPNAVQYFQSVNESEWKDFVRKMSGESMAAQNTPPALLNDMELRDFIRNISAAGEEVVDDQELLWEKIETANKLGV